MAVCSSNIHRILYVNCIPNKFTLSPRSFAGACAHLLQLSVYRHLLGTADPACSPTRCRSSAARFSLRRTPPVRAGQRSLVNRRRPAVWEGQTVPPTSENDAQKDVSDSAWLYAYIGFRRAMYSMWRANVKIHHNSFRVDIT